MKLFTNMNIKTTKNFINPIVGRDNICKTKYSDGSICNRRTCRLTRAHAHTHKMCYLRGVWRKLWVQRESHCRCGIALSVAPLGLIDTFSIQSDKSISRHLPALYQVSPWFVAAWHFYTIMLHPRITRFLKKPLYTGF